MVLLSPPLFCLPSFLSLQPLKFYTGEYPAETLIGFKDTEAIDALASREAEEDEGGDDLFIRPAPGLHVKMGGDAFLQIEDGCQI
jgi:hypothetical protein